VIPLLIPKCMQMWPKFVDRYMWVCALVRCSLVQAFLRAGSGVCSTFAGCSVIPLTAGCGCVCGPGVLREIRDVARIVPAWVVFFGVCDLHSCSGGALAPNDLITGPAAGLP